LYREIREKYLRDKQISVAMMMQLDDSELFERWNKKGYDYRTAIFLSRKEGLDGRHLAAIAALRYQAEKVLSSLGIEGDTMLKLCISAWNQGCNLRDRGLIQSLVTRGDLKCLRFVLDCVEEEFFQFTSVRVPSANTSKELNSFLNLRFPYLRTG